MSLLRSHPRKGKPIVRLGRKAMGRTTSRSTFARLPKGTTFRMKRTQPHEMIRITCVLFLGIGTASCRLSPAARHQGAVAMSKTESDQLFLKALDNQ